MYIENVEHMYLHVRLLYIFVEFYAMHMMFGIFKHTEYTENTKYTAYIKKKHGCFQK